MRLIVGPPGMPISSVRLILSGAMISIGRLAVDFALAHQAAVLARGGDRLHGLQLRSAHRAARGDDHFDGLVFRAPRRRAPRSPIGAASASAITNRIDVISNPSRLWRAVGRAPDRQGSPELKFRLHMRSSAPVAPESRGAGAHHVPARPLSIRRENHLRGSLRRRKEIVKVVKAAICAKRGLFSGATLPLVQWRFRRPSVLTWLVAAMLILLPVLAVLQFRWLGQLSDAERERLQRNLRATTTEITTRARPRAGPGDGRPAGRRAARSMSRRGSRYAERYAAWGAAAIDPALVRDVLLADADGTRRPYGCGAGTPTPARSSPPNGRDGSRHRCGSGSVAEHRAVRAEARGHCPYGRRSCSGPMAPRSSCRSRRWRPSSPTARPAA